jgi:hypothetical protein
LPFSPWPNVLTHAQCHKLSLRIGRFLLIDINNKLYGSSSKVKHYFPAEVMKNEAGIVSLQWHQFNWFPFGPPRMFRDKQFKLTIAECMDALTRETLVYNTRVSKHLIAR